jgi:hypothetical protein
LLIKILPKLTSGEENLLINTTSWILSSIVQLENHKNQSNQLNEILNLYVCIIQAYKKLNINNNKVRKYFKLPI